MRGGGAAAAGGRAEGEVRRMAGGLATFFFSPLQAISHLGAAVSFVRGAPSCILLAQA